MSRSWTGGRPRPPRREAAYRLPLLTRFDSGRVDVHRRKRIPHWDAEHGTQFVTFETIALHFDVMTAAIVAETLVHSDGSAYELLAWCVMPNHVHVVLRTTKTIATLIKTWKSVSARKITRQLNVTGAVWRPDYWDR